MKQLTIITFCICSLCLDALATDIAVVVKSTGSYAIISKGAHQGIKRGQKYHVKRAIANAVIDVGIVSVIRVTENRAAVQVMHLSDNLQLKKGDRVLANVTPSNGVSARQELRDTKVDLSVEGHEIQTTTTPKVPNTQASAVVSLPGSGQKFSRSNRFINPWLGFNVGGVIPSGDLGQVHKAGFRFGAVYMLAMNPNLNFGVELNQAVLGRSGLRGVNLIGSGSLSSASVLEVLAVLQRFIGPNFYLEGGGGIFRPKFQTLSADRIEASFSAAKFGLFGGAGIYLPTSPYVGVALSGRLHNYFDQTNKQYFGLNGGLRFRVH